jgi:hypothetical protein
MNKAKAKEFLIKRLLPSIKSYGYQERKIKSSDFNFARKTTMGYDEIIGGLNDYNSRQKVVYSVEKRHRPIINILLQLQARGGDFLPSFCKTSV